MISNVDSPNIFNTSVECAIRIGALLAEVYPRALDIHTLAHLDYILVHSADLGGPPSLHPAIPHRSGEWLVRQKFIRAGLNALGEKGLVTVDVSAEGGIQFKAADRLIPFLRLLHSEYSRHLMLLAKWVASDFGRWLENDLRLMLQAKVTSWGIEFELDGSTSEEQT